MKNLIEKIAGKRYDAVFAKTKSEEKAAHAAVAYLDSQIKKEEAWKERMSKAGHIVIIAHNKFYEALREGYRMKI